MPLIKSKSKKAFEHNLKAELGAGKPKDQSLAIAFSIKRRAPKKMADGGMATPSPTPSPDPGAQTIANTANSTPGKKFMETNPFVNKAMGGEVDAHYDSIADAILRKRQRSSEEDNEPSNLDLSEPSGIYEPYGEESMDSQEQMLAHGGMAEEDSDEGPYFSHPEAENAMEHMVHKMADGGEVDLDSHETPDALRMDQYDAIEKELYDDEQISPQPHDSNLHGDTREDDAENIEDEDTVSAIRRRMKNR